VAGTFPVSPASFIIPGPGLLPMAFPVGELLLKPDGFFARVTSEAENLVPPAVIVGIAGIIGCLSGTLVLLTAGDMMVLLIPFTLISAMALPFITWAIFTAVLHGLSRLLSGAGSFTTTLQNTGYGMLPWTIAHAFTLLSAIEMSWNVEYYRTAEGMRSMLTLSGTRTAFLVLAVLFMLWTGYLWVYGTRHAHRLTVKKAVIPVACLLVLYFIVTLVPALLAYSQMASIVNSLPPLP
jgi:hypothetical protein